MNIKHIMIIDDDDRIRDLLGKFLKDNGYFVTLAANATDAKEKLKSYIFDLLVVDVMMPDQTGVEFTEELRQNDKTPILMLTAMGEVEDRIKGLSSGADDYLAKPFEARELLLRIQRILDRTEVKSNNILKFDQITFDSEKSLLKNGDDEITISSNEAELLNILAKRIGQAISREELSRLCGSVNERTIDVRITRLRNKSERDTKMPKYLKTVRGKGYVLYSD